MRSRPAEVLRAQLVLVGAAAPLATARRRRGAVLVHALVDDAEVAAGVAREPLHLLLRAAPLVSATEVTPEHIIGLLSVLPY
jgi:hypothetical protein